jgi:methanogenic corrinoid protein MtbC1
LNGEAQEPLEQFFRTVANVDAVGAIDVVMELLESGAVPTQIIREVLGPAQVRVGELWEQGKWSVADEHAATAVTETALAALSAATTRRTAAQRHVVVACAEGEWHTLPARMAASAVAASGDVRVTMLEPSLPAEQLGRRLAAGDVDLLALSCTLPTNLIGAARSIAAAHATGVPVIAGGRAFGPTPRRAEAIGADTWAADASDLLGPVPDLTGISTAVPLEALLLDGVSDSTVALAYDRMIGAFPRLEAMTPFQQARTREDLRWMARFTAATVLTADATILDEFLSWLGRLLAGKVPVPVLATSAHLVADVVEPQAPVAAQLLHEAAARFEEDTS